MKKANTTGKDWEVIEENTTGNGTKLDHMEREPCSILMTPFMKGNGCLVKDMERLDKDIERLDKTVSYKVA